LWAEVVRKDLKAQTVLKEQTVHKEPMALKDPKVQMVVVEPKEQL
jgi:hypothetical protein